MHALFFQPPIEQSYLGHIFKEIYFDKVYEPLLVGKKDLTIVDIGAFIGITGYYFSQFASRVIAVEPSTESFDLLSRMVTFNKTENIKPINKAIYMKAGKYPFYEPSNKTMRSLHQAVGGVTEMVDAITIEDLFKEEKIEHCHLLKLDVEGSEFEILGHTSFKNVAPLIDTLVVERHAWSNRQPQQLIDSLKNAGFNNIQRASSEADVLVAQK
jgi:FkbM family methyltransferase